MQNSIERQTILPTVSEIGNIDIGIAFCCFPGPFEQGFLEGHGIVQRENVRQLEVKNDGPYQAQSQLGIAVHNVVGSNVDKFDLEK